MPDIRFGVNIRAVPSRQGFERLVRRADELGYDVLAAPDHLGAPSPFAALAAAGLVSGRLRLRTYVLNVGFWNPALLAREVATLDALSEGRVDLGLGAGHMRGEHDDAGLPWRPFPQRVELLEQTILDVRRRLAGEGLEPRPVQRPVPVLVGAMSHEGLAVAARHADIVGFSGLRQQEGAPAGTFTLCSGAETVQRVEAVRREAGGRRYRSDVLLQRVQIDCDPEEAAAEIAGAVPGLSVDQILDTPFVLLAPDADHAAEELRRRRVRYGFDSVTTHEPNMETLGRVMAAYRS
jgi:probable F420-dependent oxidoreductase